MKVRVTMTIETEDYGGQEFKNEIEALVADIDQKARLTQFTMQRADGVTNVFKDLVWEAPDLNDGAFNRWLRIVDTFMWMNLDCSLFDFPDASLRGWFEDGLGPVEVARRVVLEGGHND